MIKLEHISKTFGDTGDGVHAVKDVSLEIGDGEIFGIIGFSGAGKSTLVRCINLLEQPTSGSITVNGQKLTWMEKQADGKSCMRTVSPQELRQARKKISMIFQGFNLLMQRTCLKNVCFPMELSGVPKAQAEKKALELLDLVGLKEKASAYPAQLSGGQKQRVAIARALATDPKVLLCDEATSALDPTTTNSILALLKELNQKLGVTVVIITHQMSVIEEICTRVAILDGGEVAEEGRVEDIFAQTLKEQGFTASAPYNGEQWGIGAEGAVCIKEGNRVHIEHRLGESASRAATVFQRLVNAGKRLLRVIEHNEGGANKDLAKFADQINALCDKWDR